MNEPIQITNIEISTMPVSFSPNVLFIHVGCNFPDELIPCEPNYDGTIEIVNQGDPGECGVIYKLRGEHYLLWSGFLNTGGMMHADLQVHLLKENYPKSEFISVIFYTGWMVDESTIAVTDQINFDTFVYVKKTNWVQMAIIAGVAVGCVGIGYTFLKKPAHYPHRG